MMGDEVYSLSEYPLVPIVEMQQNDLGVRHMDSPMNMSPEKAPHQSITASDGTHEQTCFVDTISPVATRLPADFR